MNKDKINNKVMKMKSNIAANINNGNNNNKIEAARMDKEIRPVLINNNRLTKGQIQVIFIELQLFLMTIHRIFQHLSKIIKNQGLIIKTILSPKTEVRNSATKKQNKIKIIIKIIHNYSHLIRCTNKTNSSIKNNFKMVDLKDNSKKIT